MPSTLTILAGGANPDLASNIADELGIYLGARTLETFPDGEIEVQLQQSVRGHDVYLVQSTSPPVHTHLFELLLLADACHRSGAEHVTAIVPYLGYARQDRRASHRQALGGRVVADVMGRGAIDRLVAVDLHTPAIEGFFGVPLEHLSAVPMLAGAVRPAVTDRSIVIAPDLGAVKLAERYARLLELPMAVIHKTRQGGATVTARHVVGDVKDRVPIIVDDMLSTGSTIEAACKALIEAGCRPRGTAVVSHGLFVGRAREILLPLPLERIFTTDSVAQHPDRTHVEVRTLGPLLAEAIRRLHAREPLTGLYEAINTG